MHIYIYVCTIRSLFVHINIHQLHWMNQWTLMTTILFMPTVAVWNSLQGRARAVCGTRQLRQPHGTPFSIQQTSSNIRQTSLYLCQLTKCADLILFDSASLQCLRSTPRYWAWSPDFTDVREGAGKKYPEAKDPCGDQANKGAKEQQTRGQSHTSGGEGDISGGF